MIETPEERKKRFQELRESIAAQLLEKYPSVELDRHQYGIDVIYYTVNYSRDEIRVFKGKRSINTAVFSLDSYFLTKEQAKEAIAKHLPAAKQKFLACREALERLKHTLDFDVSYSIEGDTHGIEDYSYISFTLNGFYFSFRLDD